MKSEKLRAAAVVLSGTSLVLTLGPGASAQQPDVIAAGLNNPRGVALGPDSALYVAEAGSGGPGPCAPGPEGTRCFGPSGSITRIDLRDGVAARVATGLPSLAGEDGSFATGVHDVALLGPGHALMTVGFGGNPAERTAQFGPAGASFARLVRLVASGNWRLSEDLGAYEEVTNPTGDEVDTNPYGILVLPGRSIVADAGANALNEVAAGGAVSTLAVFPDRLVDAPPFLGLPPGTLIPMDAVPTSVTVGPDGDYYVGQLTGFPFPVGGANVYRVPAHGGVPEIHAEGFTAIIDLAFGPDGSLYVLEIARNGLLAAFMANDWTGGLVRVAPDGTRSEVVPGQLFAPGGVAAGTDVLYVTDHSIFSGAGRVLRIRP